MKRIALIAAICSGIILLGACAKDHTDLPTGFTYDPPPTPTGLSVADGGESATVSWEYPSESMGALGEFRVYYYYELYEMMELIGTTTETSFIDSLLVGNLYYCYSVSAVDTAGLEGWRAESVCEFITSAGR